MKYPIGEDEPPPDKALESGRDSSAEPTALEVVRAAGVAVLDPCSRWERGQLDFPSLPMWVQTTMKTQLDPADWRTGFLAVQERPISHELQADLRENVPQAFLRDLFRPVKNFYVTPEEIEGTRLIGRWKESVEEVRAAKILAPLPTVEPAVEWVRASQAERQAFLDEDWQPWLPDDAPRRALKLHVTENIGEFPEAEREYQFDGDDT